MSRWDFMLVVPREQEERANDIMVEFKVRDGMFCYQSDHDYEGVTRFFFKGDIGDVIGAFRANKIAILN